MGHDTYHGLFMHAYVRSPISDGVYLNLLDIHMYYESPQVASWHNVIFMFTHCSSMCTPAYLWTNYLHIRWDHTTGQWHVIYTFYVDSPRAPTSACVLIALTCVRSLICGRILATLGGNTLMLHGLYNLCVNARVNSARQYTFEYCSHIISKRCQVPDGQGLVNPNKKWRCYPLPLSLTN
jgi:hypothetical protein